MSARCSRRVKESVVKNALGRKVVGYLLNVEGKRGRRGREGRRERKEEEEDGGGEGDRKQR